MFAPITTTLLTLLAARSVLGVMTPTVPDSKTVDTAGETCHIQWKGDDSGEWAEMYIQLMTGENLQMTHLTTVAKKVDGSQDGNFGYPCPEVEPPAPIYFYQFSTPSNTTLRSWTTRFTIADKDGKTEPAEHQRQPNGDKVPWGEGVLVNKADFVKPPAYLDATPASASASGSASASATRSSSASATRSADSGSAEPTRFSMTRTQSQTETSTPTSTPSSAAPEATESSQPSGARSDGAGSAATWSVLALSVLLGSSVMML